MSSADPTRTSGTGRSLAGARTPAHNARAREDRQPADRTITGRSPQPRSSGVLRVGAWVAAVAITAIAFRANFYALRDFAEHQGGMPDGSGWQLPVGLDLLVGLGVLRYMDVGLRLLRRSRLGVLLIVLGSSGTIAGNVAHSWSSGPAAIAVAVAFPVLLLLGWETAMLMLRERLESTPAPHAPPAHSPEQPEQSSPPPAPEQSREQPAEQQREQIGAAGAAPEQPERSTPALPPAPAEQPARLHAVPGAGGVSREQIRRAALEHRSRHGDLPSAAVLAVALGCGQSTAGKVLTALRRERRERGEDQAAGTATS